MTPVALSQFDINARQYLRAVERAASDRLSRVRRDEVLVDVLGAVIKQSPRTPLGPADELWLETPGVPDSADNSYDGDHPDGDPDLDVHAEREEAERVLRSLPIEHVEVRSEVIEN